MMIRMDTRIIRALLAVVVAVAVLAGLSFAANALAPTTFATQSELDAQRASAERSLQKIYLAGVGQLRTSAGLKHALSDAEVQAIERKYEDQMQQLRVTALQALATAFGQSADQGSQYAAAAVPRLDAMGPTPTGAPALLAPRLFVVVDRMQQLTSSLTDTGIREMGQTPSATPTARPSASPSPSR